MPNSTNIFDDIIHLPADASAATPHDLFFRSVMQIKEVGEAFLKTHLPSSIKTHLDFDTLKFEPTSYVDSRLNLNICDVVYSAKLADRLAYFVTLIEHQSTAVKLMPLRLLGYQFDAMEPYGERNGKSTRPLPLVYPVVVYHGERRPYPYPTTLTALIDAPEHLVTQVWGNLPSFHLIDLTCIEDQTLRENLWLGTVEFALKHIYARDFYPALKTLVHEFLKPLEQKGGMKLSQTVLKYVEVAAEVDKNLLVEVVSQELSETTRGEIMTPREQWIQQGLQQGVQQGVQQGEKKGIEITLMAIDLLNRGHSLETVARETKLSLDILQRLCKPVTY